MSNRSDRGFTLIELLIVVAIISLLAAIATPGLLRARMTGNEASAIASLKITTTGQVAYSAACGDGGYAASYVVLATPITPGGPGFISEDLGGAILPQKTGYQFSLGPGAGAGAGPADCNGAATTTKYYASAIPLAFSTTGTRSFAVATDGSIWQINLATAPTEPLGPPATPIQ